MKYKRSSGSSEKEIKYGSYCAISDNEKAQPEKDQDKAQSEKDSHSKNRGGEKTELTIRYLYNENIL